MTNSWTHLFVGLWKMSPVSRQKLYRLSHGAPYALVYHILVLSCIDILVHCQIMTFQNDNSLFLFIKLI